MIKVSLMLLTCATFLSAAEAGLDASRLARIPVRMKEYVEQGTAAGFVTLVARHGRVASLEAVGYQDLETKVPMRTDSIFRIKSMTKPMTAAGIMILADEARVSLLDPVEKYLTEFKGMQLKACSPAKAADCEPVKPSRPITIRDLMTHTSGLADNAGRSTQPVETLADMVRNGGNSRLVSEPGTVWRYSNIGFATLGRLIEVISGQPYDVFMSERLFKPLGMKDTYFFLPSAKESRVAGLYTIDAAGKLTRATAQERQQAASKIPGPEGGLYSTATDQFAFYQMLLNKGTFNGQRVLSAAAVEAITTNQTGDLKGVEFSPGLGMGFGFGVVKEALGTFRYQTIGSFMKGGAYRTLAWGDPERDLVGIILYQRTNGGGDTAAETNAFVTLAEAAAER